MPFEITITEIKIVKADTGNETKERIDRLKMTIDGELDLQSVIKSVTGVRRKRNAKKAT